MINLFTNVLKAAVAVVVTPVAIVADVLTLPASSMDPHRGPFDRTASMLGAAGDCIKAAITPRVSKSSTEIQP
jgi:hypothetical protein